MPSFLMLVPLLSSPMKGLEMTGGEILRLSNLHVVSEDFTIHQTDTNHYNKHAIHTEKHKLSDTVTDALKLCDTLQSAMAPTKRTLCDAIQGRLFSRAPLTAKARGNRPSAPTTQTRHVDESLVRWA